MAWRRRRRWRRRRLRRPRRRWGFRRRRGYRRRARRGYLRPRFPRFRRRLWVRRRRFRRKRQYRGPVTQWNPQHRVGCKIRGWLPLVMCIKGHFGEKSEVFYQRKDRPDSYLLCGGSVAWRHITLGMLYREHQLFRNVWTRSNASYDLARYFGTKFRFYPHPWFDYIVYWQTSFNLPERGEVPEYLHPAQLILSKKHILVKSQNKKGRRKKLWIKPPPVHTNQWYFQNTWCNIPLLKIGITPVNFNNPFLHTGNQYGVWFGYTSDTDTSHTITWTREDITGSWDVPYCPSPQTGGEESKTPDMHVVPLRDQWFRRCYYRWWWDDGQDNYVMLNKYNLDPKDAGVNSCEVVKINQPYWQFFWGLTHLTAKQSNPQLCTGGVNPSIYAISWYKDTECQGTDIPEAQWTAYQQANKPVYPPPDPKLFGYPDQDLCGPSKIPKYGEKKYWCFISKTWPWLLSSYHVTKSYCLPDYDDAREQLTRLTGSGPFVLNYQDITFASRTINIPVSYTSYWQWGGFRPTPDSTEDPCKVGGENPPIPGQKSRRLQIENPADTRRVTIHPWDFEQSQLYSKLTFKRLISDIYPNLSAEPEGVEQPGPSDGEPPRKSRRTGESPPPEKSSESSDSDSWVDAASASETQEEEGLPLVGSERPLHRKRHHRHWKQQRQRKKQHKRQQLLRFLSSVKGIKGYRD
nr:MAG: ORF1 [Torque teno polar bear virus 2]